MKRHIPSLSVFLMILLMLSFSCKQDKEQKKVETDIPEKSVPSDELGNSDGPLIFSTKTGKAIELKTLSSQDGLFDLHLIPKGFEFSKDTLIILDSDPLMNAFLADLDKNGFEEIYLVTSSAGSGSYGTIYGYSSNNDKSISPIYVAPIDEKELSAGGLFEGYMGHDSIYLDQGKLMRKFPIYTEGDANCCPTGGQATITYTLKAGEASWKLIADKQ